MEKGWKCPMFLGYPPAPVEFGDSAKHFDLKTAWVGTSAPKDQRYHFDFVENSFNTGKAADVLSRMVGKIFAPHGQIVAKEQKSGQVKQNEKPKPPKAAEHPKKNVETVVETKTVEKASDGTKKTIIEKHVEIKEPSKKDEKSKVMDFPSRIGQARRSGDYSFLIPFSANDRKSMFAAWISAGKTEEKRKERVEVEKKAKAYLREHGGMPAKSGKPTKNS
jgi:hypothetical protein